MKALPSEDDNVEIRHMVYAGIAGPFAGTVATGNTTSEASVYGTNPAANSIIVANLPNAAFILGNEDNGATYVFRTKSTTGVTSRT
jgi:hypothetical protein